MTTLDAIIASILFILPGFLCLRVYLHFTSSDDSKPIDPSDVVLLSVGLSLVLQILYFALTVASFKHLPRFSSDKLHSEILRVKYLLGLSTLLALAIVLGFLAGKLVDWRRQKKRGDQHKSFWMKRQRIKEVVFDRDKPGYMTVFFEDFAIRGWPKVVGSDKDDNYVLLSNPKWGKVANGDIEGNKMFQMDQRLVMLDLTTVQYIRLDKDIDRPDRTEKD